MGRKLFPAEIADGQAGESGEGVAADAAVSREKDGRKAVQRTFRGTSEHANHRAPARCLRQGNFGDADGGVS